MYGALGWFYTQLIFGLMCAAYGIFVALYCYLSPDVLKLHRERKLAYHHQQQHHESVIPSTDTETNNNNEIHHNMEQNMPRISELQSNDTDMTEMNHNTNHHTEYNNQ